MTKAKNKAVNYPKLKIGDIIYRTTETGMGRVSALAYHVVEIRESTDSVQYVIECQSCSDHEKCLILVNNHTKTTFRFVSMINNDGYYCDEFSAEDSYYSSRDETSYHDTNDGVYFATTKHETTKFFIEKNIEIHKKEIEQHQKQIKFNEKSISEYEMFLETLKEK